MSTTVFNTITSDDWKRAIANVPSNDVARQIHEKVSILRAINGGNWHLAETLRTLFCSRPTHTLPQSSGSLAGERSVGDRLVQTRFTHGNAEVGGCGSISTLARVMPHEARQSGNAIGGGRDSISA